LQQKKKLFTKTDALELLLQISFLEIKFSSIAFVFPRQWLCLAENAVERMSSSLAWGWKSCYSDLTTVKMQQWGMICLFLLFVEKQVERFRLRQ
jgi:hypothetical protein